MPMTIPGRQALEEISRQSAAFEARYSHVRYQDIPKDELKAQRERDIQLWNDTRAACYARSAAHGELFDLENRCILSDDENARRNELWRVVYPLFSAPADSITAQARVNPSLAAA